MAQIDALLQSMAKFGAQGALLASGEKVQLVFPTGKRYASQTTPHEALVKLVNEIVPANTHLNLNGGTTFAYAYNGSAVTVRVEHEDLVAGGVFRRVHRRVRPGERVMGVDQPFA